MATFLNYLVVLVLFVLLTLPSFLGHAGERRIDRQLKQAENPRPHRPETIRSAPGRRPVRRTVAADVLSSAGR
ncbi:hypothetical protein [Streptomyces chryseus]|uniref:Uncharacterized protein n=1 Tax=Streptomyces chryseus TaxID=68186 RepID=A0ABQ3E4U0_9ACTN|nr:hypothetical protein GCM10010353_21180 [Streptomyces chryseus]GHB23216.1 hypothetical protein GCM10010346_53630 [Streptomyces chryseus]